MSKDSNDTETLLPIKKNSSESSSGNNSFSLLGERVVKTGKLIFRNKFIISIILIIILVAIGYFLKRSFIQVQSIQAFINGEVIFIRTPIAGKLKLDSKRIKLGSFLKKKFIVATIESSIENQQISTLNIRRLSLDSDLKRNLSQFEGINQQIRNRTQLLNFFKNQRLDQQQLEIRRSQQQLEEAKSNFAKAKAIEQVEIADAKRFKILASKGVIDISTAERRTSQAQQAISDSKAAESRVSEANTNLRATISGYQLLDGSRSLSFPEIRTIELETEILDLRQRANDISKSIYSIESELKGLQKEIKNQKFVSIETPHEGVIWSIDSKSGEQLGADAPIMQLLNCSNTWVEAFVDEQNAKKILVGQPVEVTLQGGQESKSWQGRVETIRAGSGRVEVGQYIVQPPPEILRRQLPVRVVAVRIALDQKKGSKSTSGKFCNAGLSVQARFINK